MMPQKKLKKSRRVYPEALNKKQSKCSMVIQHRRL